jgi:hypothetical protein
MSRTGIPIITTPIATLPLTQVTSSTPTSGQTLIYNGTTFVYQTPTQLALSYGIIRVTATNSFGVFGAPIAVPSTTGSISLTAGTYMVYSHTMMASSTLTTYTMQLSTVGGSIIADTGYLSLFNGTSRYNGSNQNSPAVVGGTSNVSGDYIGRGIGKFSLVSSSTISLTVTGAVGNVTTYAGSIVQFFRIS